MAEIKNVGPAYVQLQSTDFELCPLPNPDSPVLEPLSLKLMSILHNQAFHIAIASVMFQQNEVFGAGELRRKQS